MSPFLPPKFLQNAHAQTLTSAVPFFAPPARLRAQKESDVWFPTRGGHALARAWKHEGKRPAVVLIHGIGGSDASLYMVRSAVGFYNAGFHVYRLNQRGAGESAKRSRGLYHAGLTDDIDTVVTALNSESSVDGVYVVGFSGGGSVALKLAGEWGASTPSHARAIVSLGAPLDLAAAAQNLNRPGTFPYRMHVLRGLLRGAIALKKHAAHATHYSWRTLSNVTGLRKFDEVVTVPMHGFASVDDYYDLASAGRWLARIRIPSLVVHAEDDPMVPFATNQTWLESRAPSVESLSTKHGGHLGWIGGYSEEQWTQTWAVRRAISFFQRFGAVTANSS